MTGGRGYAVGHLRDVQMVPQVRQYMERIESTFEPFGGEWVVHGVEPDVLEGDWNGALVIIGFPSLAAARDWFDSPEYQDICHLRSENSDSRVVLLQGVPAGYRAADTIAKMFAA